MPEQLERDLEARGAGARRNSGELLDLVPLEALLEAEEDDRPVLLIERHDRRLDVARRLVPLGLHIHGWRPVQDFLDRRLASLRVEMRLLLLGVVLLPTY